MNITILNGDPDSRSIFSGYIHEIAKRQADKGHQVTALDLCDLDLKGCSGCWGCWVKTPGECVKRDDSVQICQSSIHSDLLVFASPITMGFTSALLKRAVEQMIALLHPYIVMEGGEMHHRARYRNYPTLGLILGQGPEVDAEDIEITTTMWTRLARNLKSRMALTAVSNRCAGEVADELIATA